MNGPTLAFRVAKRTLSDVKKGRQPTTVNSDYSIFIPVISK